MTNDEESPNAPAFAELRRGRQMTKQPLKRAHRHSDFDIPSSFVLRDSSLQSNLVATDTRLAELLKKIEAADRVALDTEADSLHSYREKLCLLQISVSVAANANGHDDFIREFSLAALLKRYFGLELPKGSQKANWAKRPLPARMAEYAINDVRYLLPLAEKLEAELDRPRRRDWLRQSCQRAIEQAAVARVRNQDELWRVRGAGLLHGRPAAVLRALWQWREREAEMADRPPFHILQNEKLVNAAESFAAGSVPDYKHFSPRRRRAFREAARSALLAPESECPVLPRRFGTRRTADTVRRTEELRRRRDKSAEELGLEPSFIAPRNTLEAIAADRTRAEKLLVLWQRELLGV